MGMSSEELQYKTVLKRLSINRTVFGSPACALLANRLDQLQAKRVLLVRDLAATEASGISDTLVECLSRGEVCGVFDIEQTVDCQQVDQLGLECQQAGYEAIVAVGGGATMDAAKLIGLRASNDCSLAEMLQGSPNPNQLPIIALPTTAGSGSEATHFAVLFVGEEKYSIAHPSLRPSLAIIDPSLTHTVPQRVAAAAGLDVLCQSIESLWSRRADRKSMVYATESLNLVLHCLQPAVMQQDRQAQQELCLASHLAGQAINRSFTTISHALSYLLTARYGVPHGMACAATLPAALLYNGRPTDIARLHYQRSGDIDGCLQVLFESLKCDTVEAAARKIVQLIRSVGGAASTAELQLPVEYNASEHAQSINPERLKNNPRRASYDDTVAILQRTFDSQGGEVSND